MDRERNFSSILFQGEPGEPFTVGVGIKGDPGDPGYNGLDVSSSL